jgi:hypothetical protein
MCCLLLYEEFIPAAVQVPGDLCKALALALQGLVYCHTPLRSNTHASGGSEMQEQGCSAATPALVQSRNWLGTLSMQALRPSHPMHLQLKLSLA